MAKETAEEFIARLKTLPDLDLTDPKTVGDFAARFEETTRPEIEKQSKLDAENIGRAFVYVVYC
ncbi:MAG: hypothetical protein V1892_00675 [bacterium]